MPSENVSIKLEIPDFWIWRVPLFKGWSSQVPLVVKTLPTNAADARGMGFNPWVGKIPWGHSNPIQYSCLDNPMDREPGGLSL